MSKLERNTELLELMNELLGKTVTLRLGNGDHKRIEQGVVVGIEEHWAIKGRYNYLIELITGDCKGMVAFTHRSVHMSVQWQRTLESEGVEYYSSNVQTYAQRRMYKCLPLGEVKEAGQSKERIAVKTSRNLEEARNRYINRLIEDYDLEDLRDLDTTVLRAMFETTLKSIVVTQTIALPNGGCKKIVRKAKQAA